MATLKQIQANRLNARQSTGPSTPKGKTRSSQNALKSGIDAEAQIIRGESAANLQAITAEYYNRFHPATPEQRMLVDTLIDSEWLLRRFRVCEAQLWKEGAEGAFHPMEEIGLAQAVFSNHNYFARLQRRIDSAHRNYRNALQELLRLQAEEAPVHSDPEPTAPSKQTTKPQNGFVPPIRPDTLLNSPTKPDQPTQQP